MHTLIAWGPAAIWVAVLFFLSEIDGTSGLSWGFGWDKVLHFLLYSILGATLAWGWARMRRQVPHWAVVSLGVVYGLVDEWHQSFVPGRSPSLGDALADLAGTVAGFALVAGLLWWHRESRSPRAS
ncbi:VanZ family protein [Gemmatimonadota bacterium]